MTLLDEIENDPEFGYKEEPTDVIMKELINMAIRTEATLLLLKAKNIITEEEYMLAYDFIREEVPKLLTSKNLSADDITRKITEGFSQKLASTRKD